MEILFKDNELFHTANGMAFIIIERRGHRETIDLDSDRWKMFLISEFRRLYRPFCETKTIEVTTRELKSRALLERNKRETYIRVAEHAGKWYVDLANDDWQVVEIDTAGWRVLDSSPVHFRRPDEMKSLPMPERCENRNYVWDSLRALVNIGAEENWMMYVAWHIAAMRPSKYPYPILHVSGQQGSGKTELLRTAKNNIDPNEREVVNKFKDIEFLHLMASNMHVVMVDNQSHVSKELSDSLAVLSTGDAYSARAMRENYKERVYKSRNPIGLAGIPEGLGENDLIDRSLVLRLPKIQHRLTMEEIEEQRIALLPQLLGCIFDYLSLAMKNLPQCPSVDLPRMADFAKLIMAGEALAPWWNGGKGKGLFLKTYQANTTHAAEISVEGDCVAQAVINLLEEMESQGQEFYQEKATPLFDKVMYHAACMELDRETLEQKICQIKSIDPTVQPEELLNIRRQKNWELVRQIGKDPETDIDLPGGMTTRSAYLREGRDKVSDMKNKKWPKSPESLGHRLGRAIPQLDKVGISIATERKGGTWYRIERAHGGLAGFALPDEDVFDDA